MNIKSLLGSLLLGLKKMTSNILVTGGAGYVGSHACKTLHENGFTPITFDNLSTGPREFVKWGPLFLGDLLNKSSIEEAFEFYNIKSVMHFAAKAYVNESVKNPILYYRENIQGSLNLIETFIEKNGRTFVFSSSCATYGTPTTPRIMENTLQQPINTYGFTKLAIEKLIINLGLLHNFNYSILRYFNVAGADSKLEIGEKHKVETHVIPLLIDAAYNKKTFEVFGSDYETQDGTAVRDFVHVNDIAEAHFRALNVMLKEERNIVCNLGSGEGASILQLISYIQKSNQDLKISHKPRRDGDPAFLVADNSLSRKILGLNYMHSDIALILNSAIAWHEKLSFKSIRSG